MVKMNVIGVVLAGGRSSRMGRNKALLSFSGSKLVDHMSERLLAGGVKRVVVSGAIPGVECIADEVSGLGPLGGLKSILNQVKDDQAMWLLVVPVDMPRLTPQNLRSLLNQCSENVDAVFFSGLEMPLVLKVSSRVREAIVFLLENTDPRLRSIRGLLMGLNTVEVALPRVSDREFANVNTPLDWSLVQ